MKVTLINPPATVKNPKRLQQVQPPLGLAYVAASLRDGGHEVRVVDGCGEGIGALSPFRNGAWIHGLLPQEIVEQTDADTAMIGIGIMFSSYWPLSKVLIRSLRARFPRAAIVCGGEHVSALARFVLDDAPVDYAVVGEGEETALELAAHLDGAPGSLPAERIAGLVYRAGDGSIVATARRQRRRALNRIPWPAWDLFPLQRYLQAGLFASMPFDPVQRPMVILATRGCPYTCKFCSNERMWGTNYFMRDPKDVVDEMEFYFRTYGATDFHFQDLTPIINAQWAHRLCQELIDRDLRVTWKTASGTRSEALDLELLKKMHRSGCDELILAPESGSSDMLRISRKHLDLDRILSVARLIRDHRIGMRVTAFLIIGFPEERLRDVLQTYVYLLRMARSGFSTVYVVRFTAYPGCEYHEAALREGKIVHDDQYFLSLERSFGLLNFFGRGASWHPRWGARFIWLLLTIAHLIFYGTYYVTNARAAVRGVAGVVRNRPHTRLERTLAYLLWQPLTGRRGVGP
jgi:radical SAM superfamily enzyme YgiQ (UPF0313 family)